MSHLRTDLHELLCSILGSREVYFQSPGKHQMSYPSIVYNALPLNTLYSNNQPYILRGRYLVTLVTKNPDTDLVNKVARLPTASARQPFIMDNLHHYPFELYY